MLARMTANPRQSRMEIRPRFYETDMMGIVHHANYLKYMEVGRVDWWRKRGITPQTWPDVQLPVYEVKIQYKRPATFDEQLVVTTTLLEGKPHTLIYRYEITRRDELLCTGETQMIVVSPQFRICRLGPDKMAQVMGGETGLIA